MPTHRKPPLLLALCLPLLLSACDGGAAKTSADPSASVTASSTASPTAKATFSPGFPVSSIYIVTAAPGITDQDLKDAVSTIAKHEGVEAASFIGNHQLRVEMSLTDLVKRSKPVYDELTKLGTVTTP
ncbi:MAG: hypothetical protein JWM40_66 [Frankiales bacterium]|nr:hypothetical protein [Frankiales bacterium]